MLVIAGLMAAALAAPAPAADPDDKAVIAAAQAFFDGLEKADVEAMRASLLPNAQFMSLRPQPDGSVKLNRTTFEDSFGKQMTPGLKEWMWSPVVVRRGPLATVTAPYEISKDGKTLHCGVDIFTLAKQDGAWKIATISWTAEPTACPELRKP